MSSRRRGIYKGREEEKKATKVIHMTQALLFLISLLHLFTLQQHSTSFRVSSYELLDVGTKCIGNCNWDNHIHAAIVSIDVRAKIFTCIDINLITL